MAINIQAARCERRNQERKRKEGQKRPEQEEVEEVDGKRPEQKMRMWRNKIKTGRNYSIG